MKYILFDLDGTITDPFLGITKSVAYALKYFNIEVNDLNELKVFIGPPLVDSFMQYYHLNHEQALVAVEKYREYFKDTGIFENKVYEGMEEFLTKLVQDGYKLALATSKPNVFAKRILEHFNLDHYFIGVYGSELDGTRSKKGEVITYALNHLNITNDDAVIMVGDRLHDIIGAHENNLKAIGVLYGYGSLEEMQLHQADYIVKDLKELYETLKTEL